VSGLVRLIPLGQPRRQWHPEHLYPLLTYQAWGVSKRLANAATKRFERGCRLVGQLVVCYGDSKRRLPLQITALAQSGSKLNCIYPCNGKVSCCWHIYVSESVPTAGVDRSPHSFFFPVSNFDFLYSHPLVLCVNSLLPYNLVLIWKS